MVWKGSRSWDGEHSNNSRIGEGREENNTNIRLEVEGRNDLEEDSLDMVIGGEEKETEEDIH